VLIVAGVALISISGRASGQSPWIEISQWMWLFAACSLLLTRSMEAALPTMGFALAVAQTRLGHDVRFQVAIALAGLIGSVLLWMLGGTKSTPARFATMAVIVLIGSCL
jgi:hypothetical protein